MPHGGALEVGPGGAHPHRPRLLTGPALRRVARHEEASILVLGSDQATAPGQVRAGPTGRQVLHDAPCAVALAAAGSCTQPTELHRIAVGLDETPESHEALHVAAELAASTGAKLHVISVVNGMPTAIGAMADVAAGTRPSSTAGDTWPSSSAP